MAEKELVLLVEFVFLMFATLVILFKNGEKIRYLLVVAVTLLFAVTKFLI